MLGSGQHSVMPSSRGLGMCPNGDNWFSVMSLWECTAASGGPVLLAGGPAQGQCPILHGIAAARRWVCCKKYLEKFSKLSQNFMFFFQNYARTQLNLSGYLPVTLCFTSHAVSLDMYIGRLNRSVFSGTSKHFKDITF